MLGSRFWLANPVDLLVASAAPLLGSADQVRAGPLRADRPIGLRGFDARHAIVIEELGTPTRKSVAIESELRDLLRRRAAYLVVSQPPMPPQDREFRSRNCGYNFVLVT